VIWLGLAPVLVGATMQFIGHVIYVNWKLRSIYSPGVATTVFGHVPIAVIYIYYVSAHHLANEWDWLLGIAYMIVFISLNFGVVEALLLGSKNSSHPFDPDEMKRFDIEGKLERARR
jgi:vacuolar-type H+-ATPase subunit I/STV1